MLCQEDSILLHYTPYSRSCILSTPFLDVSSALEEVIQTSFLCWVFSCDVFLVLWLVMCLQIDGLLSFERAMSLLGSSVWVLGPQLVVLFGKGMSRTFGVGTFLEGACHWEWYIRMYSLPLLTVLWFQTANALWLGWLQAPVMPFCPYGQYLHLWNYEPNKPFCL